MRLSARGMRLLRLYHGTETKGRDGGKQLIYGEPAAEIFGNIQPYTNERGLMEYGISPAYGYQVLTNSALTFSETDAIGENGPEYRIRAVLPWSRHTRLIVEHQWWTL